MTKLTNDPKAFGDEAIAGFAAAYPRHVQRVHGGVVRSTTSPAGQVALVLGGGAGHYPAFAGWVGPGMGHGAACGNVFASPSASQVYAVARAADNGGGVLLGFGNYAGDVLHFGQAAERLRAEGTEVVIMAVTDDVASGPAEDWSLRRGIAGDLVVFKIAGAAAEAGLDLAGVEQVARRANERTRTLGVAFSGATLPGAGEPLFTVADDTMAIGLGIHGEPGVSEQPIGTADHVADTLVYGVLAEEPPRGADGYEGRVVVLLNGLGGTKYEELFVVYRRVLERLGQAGLTVVEPEVGELVTSLDMAGLSLTLTFLDPALESYWKAPADTPAFKRGAITDRAPQRQLVEAAQEIAVEPGDAASQQLAARVVRAIRVLAETAAEHEQELGRLDAVAGDGDHGQGMVLGTAGALRAAEEAMAAGAGARTLLLRAGDAWSESAGGTSGALWGSALTAVGGGLSDTGEATDDAIVSAARAGADAIVRLGGAKVGDKTMVDALIPFADTLGSASAGGSSLAESWLQAAQAATEAAAGTAEITARLGRAKTHGEHSLGHADPGATSFALLMTAVARLLGDRHTQTATDSATETATKGPS